MMKIDRAKVSERELMLRYFKESFPETHGKEIEAFFHAFYKPEETFVLRNHQNEIMGVASVRPKILRLNHKNLKVSYINRIFTRPKYQGLGNMNLLIEGVLNYYSKTDLITLLRVYEPKIFEKFGFENVINIGKYTINPSKLPRFGVEGIVPSPRNHNLVSTYQRFTQHFDGFFLRNEEDFENMKKYYSHQNGNIIGLKVKNELVGYCVYITHAAHVEVMECVYDKSSTLLQMLSFISKGKNRIVLNVSEKENIEKIIPHATKISQPFMLARINDKDLFERLYDIKIISSYSAFKAFGKPLFNRDFQ